MWHWISIQIPSFLLKSSSKERARWQFYLPSCSLSWLQPCSGRTHRQELQWHMPVLHNNGRRQTQAGINRWSTISNSRRISSNRSSHISSHLSSSRIIHLQHTRRHSSSQCLPLHNSRLDIVGIHEEHGLPTMYLELKTSSHITRVTLNEHGSFFFFQYICNTITVRS